MKSFTIKEINKILKGELVGDTNRQIEGPEQLEKAGNNHITFIGSIKYVPLWETSNACAAIVDEKLAIEPGENRALIKVKNADLAMAHAMWERMLCWVMRLFYFPMLQFLMKQKSAMVLLPGRVL